MIFLISKREGTINLIPFSFCLNNHLLYKLMVISAGTPSPSPPLRNTAVLFISFMHNTTVRKEVLESF